MPLVAYPDLGLFVRAARILPLVGIAAFAGGVVGGLVVFAINGALAPPRPDLSIDSHAADSHAAVAVGSGKPVTILGGTAPNPATTQPPPAAPGPTQVQSQTPPIVSAATTAQAIPQDEPRPTRWPNALMRGRKVITPLPPPAVAPAPGEAEEEKSAQTDHKSSGAAAASGADDRSATRRHAHAAKKRDKEFSSNAGARQAGDRAYSRVHDYNYYDSAGADERYGGRRRAVVRGQRPQWTRPAEAAQPWSGQFWGGGGYYH
jgi:hypothetical protein